MTETKSTSCEEIVKCKKCAICIYTELGLYTICAGPCKRSFHAACAGVSREALRFISRGLLWMCGECSPIFNEWIESKERPPSADDTSSIHAEITELKSQVSLVVDTLQRLATNETQSTAFHHSTPVVAARGINARFEDAVERDDTETEHAEPKENRQTVPNDRYFSLLLTNIDNGTCENDIERLVNRCLGATTGDCVEIVKLVSNRSDCSLLDYISFKVVLKWRWKDVALWTSTWPTGIVFREFRQRRCNVWKP